MSNPIPGEGADYFINCVVLKMSQSEECSSVSHKVLIKENRKLQEDWGVHCLYIHVHVEVKLSFNFRHIFNFVCAGHRHGFKIYNEKK